MDEPTKDLKIDIIDCCILDGTLSSPSLISNIKKLHTNNEYFLYLNIHATQKTQYFLNVATNALKLLPRSTYEDIAMPGYNSILIKCLAKYPFHGMVSISIHTEDNTVFTYESLPLIVEEADDIQVTYAQQQQIIQEIYTAAKTDFYRNTILTVSGDGGSGKTYLLGHIIQSLSKEDTEILRLSFSEKESENASSICKLLLFINFGFLYDLSQQAFVTLIKKYTNFSSDVFLQLREGALDQITALNIIDTISEMLNKTDMALFPDKSPMINRNISYIIVDDFQKITKRHKTICQHILVEFASRNYAQLMLVGDKVE